MDEHSGSETRCKNPACKRLLAQNGSGHRKREYCDDTCRQAARRYRLEQNHRDEVARRWAAFTPETRSFLDWVSTRYSFGKDLAYAVELAINREIDRYSAESSAQVEPALAALREKQLSRVEKLKARIHQLEQEAEQPRPRAVLSVEQAHERAGLHGYLDGSYLESTQRLFVSVFQTGQVEPNEVREAIHQERGAETARLRQRIAELEQAQRSPIEEHNIRRIEQYAIECSLDAGQAKERIAALEQELADACQGRDQVQERFREYVCMTNEKLGELTGELAKRRQEQERAAGQEDQRNIEDYREKLAQAGQRVAKLEKQVEVQRQRLGHYYQRFYPSSLAVAAEKLLALGAALGYKPLLKYDELTVGIAAGAQSWQEFARTANYEDMAQAILQAERFQQQLAERYRRQADEQEEAAIHRLIVQEYAARIFLSFPALAQCEIPFERDGTTYSIVIGNLPNHKIIAKLTDGDKYEMLEVSEQEAAYIQEYCYRQLYQTYQARLDVREVAQTRKRDNQVKPN